MNMRIHAIDDRDRHDYDRGNRHHDHGRSDHHYQLHQYYFLGAFLGRPSLIWSPWACQDRWCAHDRGRGHDRDHDFLLNFC